jgi:ATP-dependent protease ClpP protease subunit
MPRPHGRTLISGGEIILSGPVVSDMYAGWMIEGDVFIAPIMLREAFAEVAIGPVTVRLNSVGGDTDAGEQIRAMLAQRGNVTVIVEGYAMSAASLLLMGGADRVMSEGSILMIHEPSTVAWGTADDLRHVADATEIMSNVYAQVYATASGQTVAEVQRMLAEETYMGPQEAVSLGFADRIAGDVVQEPAPVSQTMRAQFRAAMSSARRLVMARIPQQNPDAGRQPAPVTALLAQMQQAPTGAANMEGAMPPEVINTPAPSVPDPNAVVMAERQRITMIRSSAAPFMSSGRLTEADIQSLVDGGVSHESAAAQMMATMAAREPLQTRSQPATITRDEGETRRIAMEGSIVARLTRAQPNDNARRYMDFSLVEMAAEITGARRVPGGFAAREELFRMAAHSTSDFPILMENALNRSLAARYAQAQPVYRQLARQRSYMDFRDHVTVRAGDFPTLKPVNPDNGEIQGGTFSEAKEKTAVQPHAIQFNLARALLVNDTLDSLSQVLADQGAAVARFEEATFFAMALGGAGADGPTMLETTRQMFNVADGSKASTAAAITVASVSIGRAAIQKRKSLDNSNLGLSPSILLVGPDKLTEAEQFVATVTANTTAAVNPFSGRLMAISTPQISGNAWYLFTDLSQAANFEWGLLDGYTAPRLRTENPFGTQGMSLSLEHDFGCGAIDWRAGYKNAGA